MAEAIDRLIELDELSSIKQLERAALLSLMDSVVEALPDALVVTDLNGIVILFNEQAELMFGYHRSEVAGQSVEMLMPDRNRARHSLHRELYGRFAVNQRARTMGIGMDLTGLHRDGHEFSADITLSRMVVPNGVFLLVLLRFSPRTADLPVPPAAPAPEREPNEIYDGI